MTALFKATYKICQQSTGPQVEKLTKHLHENFNQYKILVSLAIIITGVYLYYPLKSYVVDGERVPFVPLEMMFVDQSTISGYCIASILMVTGGILAVLSTLYMGLSFVALILNYGPRVDILETNFKELDEMWCDASKSTIGYRHMFLRNICLKFIDMRQYAVNNNLVSPSTKLTLNLYFSYIAEIKEVFDQKLFIFFAFAYLSQILCLYQIRVVSFF